MFIYPSISLLARIMTFGDVPLLAVTRPARGAGSYFFHGRNEMNMINSLVVFLVSLLIGALGIHVGAAVIADVTDYTYAFFTALFGAIVWSIVGFFFGWIPFLGPVIVLLAYLAVVKRRYPGGWIDAAGITLVAWISVVLVLYGLAAVGFTTFDAVGVPGT